MERARVLMTPMSAPAGLVDQHLEDAAGQVEVVQIEVSVGDEGHDDVPYTVGGRHRQSLTSS